MGAYVETAVMRGIVPTRRDTGVAQRGTDPIVVNPPTGRGLSAPRSS